MWMVENATLSGSTMAHMGLFVPTIMGQGSDDQQSWWLYRALNFEIIGGYAQTELGHGSNVRGLRTVAEYDPATEVGCLRCLLCMSMLLTLLTVVCGLAGNGPSTKTLCEVGCACVAWVGCVLRSSC